MKNNNVPDPVQSFPGSIAFHTNKYPNWASENGATRPMQKIFIQAFKAVGMLKNGQAMFKWHPMTHRAGECVIIVRKRKSHGREVPLLHTTEILTRSLSLVWFGFLWFGLVPS